MWEGHSLPQKRAKGCPILLDLLLLNDKLGRFKEIELKVKGGKVSPDQNALILRSPGAEVVWNMDELKAAVLKWEESWKS